MPRQMSTSPSRSTRLSECKTSSTHCWPIPKWDAAAATETVHVSEAVDTALRNLRTSIDESGAVITRDSLPTVHVNLVELIQVFQNLIGNAIKFRGDRKPEIHIGVRKENGHWRVTVRDNGIGIKPEFAEKIFTIFQRLHTQEEYPGSGVVWRSARRSWSGTAGRFGWSRRRGRAPPSTLLWLPNPKEKVYHDHLADHFSLRWAPGGEMG